MLSIAPKLYPRGFFAFGNLNPQLLWSEDNLYCLVRYKGEKVGVKPLFRVHTHQDAPDASFLSVAALALVLAGGGRGRKFYSRLVCLHAQAHNATEI